MTGFDFDHAPDRRGTACSKWDDLAARTGADAPDAIAMWVADMEFPAPPAVREALAAAVSHGVFGYSAAAPQWRAASAAWSRSRHGWAVDPDWITYSAGVCAGLALCALEFAGPGEGVAMMAPVYHQFAGVTRAAGRRPVEVATPVVQGRFALDIDRLRAEIPADARVFLLCSPHNPGGRVWSAEELRAIADFCAERDMVLVSDEIWRDLVFAPARHIPTLVAAPEQADRIVTLTAPSKTFNIAGLQAAEVVISDPALRRRYRNRANAAHGTSGSTPGYLGAEAAYRHGAAWLDALLPYLQANQRGFADALAEGLPGARVMAAEATYLAWVDFSETGLSEAEIARRVTQGARIGANTGQSFGPGGALHMRFNLACPRAMALEAASRLVEAFR